MVSKIIDYFKHPENLSILLFVLYVVALTHLVLAFVLSLCLKL